MIGLGLLLALQQAGTDSLCGSPALCRIVAEAAKVNAAPGRLASYTARVELEASIISVKDEVVDGPTAVQQVMTEVSWVRTGPFSQRAIGARSRFSAVPISSMRYLLIGWIVPLTYGDRIPVFGKQSGGDVALAAPADIDPELVYAVHPLASDRERYYRYVSADTVDVALSRRIYPRGHSHPGGAESHPGQRLAGLVGGGHRVQPGHLGVGGEADEEGVEVRDRDPSCSIPAVDAEDPLGHVARRRLHVLHGCELDPLRRSFRDRPRGRVAEELESAWRSPRPRTGS